MIETGNWIALHRKIIDSAVFADAELLRLWVWILSRASFRVVHLPMTIGRGQTIVELSPGQLVIGRNTGAAALGWKPSTFRDRLERLAKLDMVTITPDTHWSVVSIVNWGTYQSLSDHSTTAKLDQARQANDNHKPNKPPDENESDTSDDNTQPTTNQQATDTHPTQYKNAKKTKNEKKKVDVVPLNEVVEYWNQQTGQSCRATDKRKASLSARWNDPWWRDHWRQAIDAAASSPFHMGVSDRGWTADLEWFLKPDSATKLVELKRKVRKPKSHKPTRGQALPLRRPARRLSDGGNHA